MAFLSASVSSRVRMASRLQLRCRRALPIVPFHFDTATTHGVVADHPCSTGTRHPSPPNTSRGARAPSARRGCPLVLPTCWTPTGLRAVWGPCNVMVCSAALAAQYRWADRVPPPPSHRGVAGSPRGMVIGLDMPRLSKGGVTRGRPSSYSPCAGAMLLGVRPNVVGP